MARRGHPPPISRLVESVDSDDWDRSADADAVETPSVPRDTISRSGKDSGMLPVLFPDPLRSAA
ncbi:hypothetical protein RO07_02855 [Pandoraea pulmonicola]|uniref:Uncharacterized protein n=1 Tax=Pandoraea pulmonicola TaxID=93221 RepID=A0AAJ4ZF93_PANPU|nr:hypothetical protein RO07_02855 [Pandoraea pulmonicola]SUA92193.1 Uncharacterised protein [Pandoraea pulmonicola]